MQLILLSKTCEGFGYLGLFIRDAGSKAIPDLITVHEFLLTEIIGKNGTIMWSYTKPFYNAAYLN
jgi:hypothetical protein